MKRSEERILTTHTGSLPRPDHLTELMWSRESGAAVDPSALRAEVQSAVNDTVRIQVEAGVDVVNDGEMSKVGYSTYVKERLTGFSGSQTMAQWRPDRAVRPDRISQLRPARHGPAGHGRVASTGLHWADRGRRPAGGSRGYRELEGRHRR